MKKFCHIYDTHYKPNHFPLPSVEKINLKTDRKEQKWSKLFISNRTMVHVDTYNIKISYPIDRSREGEQGIGVHLLDPVSWSLRMAL